MAKGRVHRSQHSENIPEWYWKYGLHDACIVGVEAFEFPFDYDKYKGKKSSENTNLFLLKIDATQALGDCSVREIRLFNYKILSSGIKLQGRERIWWLADSLQEENGQYVLEIKLQDLNAYPEDFTFKIRFARAEVERG